MPEPLLTSVYCPFNLLQSFKDGFHSIEVKQISPSCKPRMLVSVSVYKKTLISVCIYIRSAHGILRVGSALRMPIVKTLRIFVHGNVMLPWAYDTST